MDHNNKMSIDGTLELRQEKNGARSTQLELMNEGKNKNVVQFSRHFKEQKKHLK